MTSFADLYLWLGAFAGGSCKITAEDGTRLPGDPDPLRPLPRRHDPRRLPTGVFPKRHGTATVTWPPSLPAAQVPADG